MKKKFAVASIQTVLEVTTFRRSAVWRSQTYDPLEKLWGVPEFSQEVSIQN